jgi:Tfp pilus assembly protein PilF
MPRTIEELPANANELADTFEKHDPDPTDIRDAAPLRELRKAFEDAAHAQKRLHDAVTIARGRGFSWHVIGLIVGTSGDAARQRYGKAIRTKRHA